MGRKKTIVYVDGFNVYYGMFKNSPLQKYKWTDIQAYCLRLRNADDLLAVYYFTAWVKGSARARQDSYIRALQTRSLVTVVFGHFIDKPVSCKLSNLESQPRFEFRRPEEKRTDVSIAVQMLDDAKSKRCENIVLIGGDTDLIPCLARIKTDLKDKMTITVYIPSYNRRKERRSAEFDEVADKVEWLPTALFRPSQLENPVQSASGPIYKPSGW
jgi:uncharacterized LabA/DUF88 family protein